MPGQSQAALGSCRLRRAGAEADTLILRPAAAFGLSEAVSASHQLLAWPRRFCKEKPRGADSKVKVCMDRTGKLGGPWRDMTTAMSRPPGPAAVAPRPLSLAATTTAARRLFRAHRDAPAIVARSSQATQQRPRLHVGGGRQGVAYAPRGSERLRG